MIFRKKKEKETTLKKKKHKKPVGFSGFNMNLHFYIFLQNIKLILIEKFTSYFKHFFFNKQTLEHSTQKHKYYLLP